MFILIKNYLTVTQKNNVQTISGMSTAVDGYMPVTCTQ